MKRQTNPLFLILSIIILTFQSCDTQVKLNDMKKVDCCKTDPCPTKKFCEPEKVDVLLTKELITKYYTKGEVVFDFTTKELFEIIKPTDRELEQFNGMDTVEIINMKIFKRINSRIAKVNSTLPPNKQIDINAGKLTKCLCNRYLFLYENETLIGQETEVVTTEMPAPNKNEGELDLNYLFNSEPQQSVNNNQTNPLQSNYYEKFNFVKNNGTVSRPKKIRVAILDSGVDPQMLLDNVHSAYSGQNNDTKAGNLYYNEEANAQDHCLDFPDYYGYNFVSMNNNILDDNGHGTMVTLSYLDALSCVPNVSLQKQEILPIKVLDACGSGTIFSAVCGLYYAIEKNADVINNSWGIYYQDSRLDNAFSEINKKSAFTCSAGNKGVNFDSETDPELKNHYPSEYTLLYNSVFEVGASCNRFGNESCTEANSHLWAKSNYRKDMWIERGVDGQTLFKKIDITCSLSGTSIAAPRLAAGLVEDLWNGNSISNISLKTIHPIGQNEIYHNH